MSSVFATFIIVLRLISLSTETSCGPYERYWCGNVCTVEGFTCNCGSSSPNFKTVDTNDKICCPDPDDTCNITSVDSVDCNNGKIQQSGTLCSNGQCLLSTLENVSVPCIQNNRTECSAPKPCDQICRGLVNTCSKNPTSEIEYCSKNRECFSLYYEKCSILPSAKFQHYEWFKKARSSKDRFDCLNRIDQWDTLFNRILFASRPEAPILNLQLEYDSQKFICDTNYSVQWKSLVNFKVNGDLGDVNCKLKDETIIKGSKLLEYLIKDQSFNPRYNNSFSDFQNFLDTFEG